MIPDEHDPIYDELNNPDLYFLPNQYPSGEFWVPVVLRDWWSPVPATSPPRPLTTPVSYVRLVATGTHTQNSNGGVQWLQVYQRFQMIACKQPDLPFNFLVDSEGVAYEAQGWKHEVERPPHLEWLRGNCLDIAYIGDFRKKNPPWRMIRAALELVKYGIRRKLIVPTFKLIQFREHSIAVR